MQSIQFEITYGFNTRRFSLPESKTIVDLKKKIEEEFHIYPHQQQFQGWLQQPRNETTRLGECLNVCMVNQIRIVKENYEYVIRINQLDPNETSLEIQSIRSLSKKWKIESIDLKHITLQDAISSFHSAPLYSKKPLFLYFHTSSGHPNFLNDENFLKIVENFTFIGWDIEDSTYHKGLIEALWSLELSFQTARRMKDSIFQKKGFALCLSPLEVTSKGWESWLYVKQSKENVCSELESVIMTFRQNINKKISECFIQSVNSLKRELTMESISIESTGNLFEAIQEFYQASSANKKPIILYFHNSTHLFSEAFVSLLKNKAFLTILEKYKFIGWDIKYDAYHDALINALYETNLSELSGFIKRKEATAFCIIPIEDNSVDVTLRLDISTITTDTVYELLLDILKECRKETTNQENNQGRMTPEQLQRTFADLLGNRDYDRFEFDEHEYLKEKIGFALLGPPQSEDGYSEKSKKRIEKMYNVINKQNDTFAESKGMIDIAFIYNCTELLDKENDNNDDANNVNPVAVFVLRKCRPDENNNFKNKLPCRIFIDDICRVYNNWNDYLKNNKLPKCKMTLPLNGKYQWEDVELLLEKHYSPACDISTTVLNVTDTAGTVAGISSGGVFIAAAIPAITVAPAVLVGAAVVGGAVGLWGIGRSIYNLVDRGTHCESLSLANSEARGAYINIVAGTFGFVGAGVNIAVSRLAATGASIGNATIYTSNAFNCVNLGVNGISVVNSTVDIVDQWLIKKETPSTLSLIQFGSSLLFFGHAVCNFKLAGTIIEESQAQSLKNYRDSLRSNRHRKTFDKLLKQTLKNSGDNMKGNSEIISSLRNIQNKDETFAALTRNQKQLSKHGVKFSSANGKIQLNGISMDMNEFMGFNKKEVNSYLLRISQESNQSKPNTVVNSTGATTTTITSNDVGIVKKTLSTLSANLCTMQNVYNLITIVQKLNVEADVKTIIFKIANGVVDYCIDKIQPILPRFGIQKCYMDIIHMVLVFIDNKAAKLEEDYQQYQRTGDEKYYHIMYKFVNPTRVKRYTAFFEKVTRNIYSEKDLLAKTLKELARMFIIWATKKIIKEEEEIEHSKNRAVHSAQSNFSPKKIRCAECGGFYYTH